MPVVRLVGGITDPPPEPSAARAAGARRAVGGRAARRRPGRACATASPRRCSAPRRCCRSSAPPTATSSCPTTATGLPGRHRGRRHAVQLTTVATTPFIRDVPAAEALAAWRAACDAAGCPDARRRGAARPARGRRAASPPSRCGRRARRRRSTPSAMDGIAVRAADTVGASESTPVLLEPGAYVVVDTGDPMPDGFDAVVMREHVHYDDAARPSCARAVAPYQHVRSIGEDVSATELLLPDRPSPAAGRRRRRRGRRRHRRARPPRARSSPCSRPATRSARSAPTRRRARSSTPTRSCSPPRPRRPAARRGARASSPTTPSGSPPRCATPPRVPTS